MKILKVIHGYPPLYNAGSEVYSQTLCHGLAEHHEVRVFTREENPFAADFSIRTEYDYLNPNIQKYMINIPGEKHHYRYRQSEVDTQFAKIIDDWQPDIIHIGHLNHLSTSLIHQISERNIPIVYTLHDYWLMCPRGQFIQRNVSSEGKLWQLCDGQADRKCATQCYSGYFSGDSQHIDSETAHWETWINHRMQHIRELVNHISLFIAPAKYLRDKYINDFQLPADKVHYMDYGFDLNRLSARQRIKEQDFVFGYIGTHIPSKGIQLLLHAFNQLEGKNAKLRIWGRARPQNTSGLKTICKQFSDEVNQKIEWLPEYKNEDIVNDVFNHVDVIVVPSIWEENSPLVIHESLQCRVPVITANIGGMAEYIQHEKNGLCFHHRNANSLAEQMQRLLNDQDFAVALGNTGYLQRTDGDVISIQQHVNEIVDLYHKLLAQ